MRKTTKQQVKVMISGGTLKENPLGQGGKASQAKDEIAWVGEEHGRCI